ncbi:MAG: ATP-dependent RecD-like DNA helicase [Proteobacteria bacterium]|nr:ATP-dependent RecD-like DNA helicase [Pseudomonadota bacterium]
MRSKEEKFEYLSGIVERVTYHNDTNGFCVLRVKVKGHRELVTVVGSVPSISAGEYIKSSGNWANNKDHGMQFKADFLKALPPNTLEGIEKYLGSGLIKGIGPHFARKLVKKFGEEVFDVIENNPEKLTQVEGVGSKRANSICGNWAEQKVVREIMIFLQSHGVGTTRATRIFKTYGDESIKIVSENPYVLARDIRGIGFISADTIAQNLGIEHDSLIRAQAGINHTLLEATSLGHCGLPKDELLSTANKLLEIPEGILLEAIDKELGVGNVFSDTIEGKEVIFSSIYYHYEKSIAKYLKQLLKAKSTLPDIDIDKAIPWCEEKIAINLADNQKLAVRTALESKIMVITGGPGTGKTTIVNSILTILKTKDLKLKLCAPTGRAAKRLSESTGLEAKTIHRMLEISPQNGQFSMNEENPLDCDCLIIDESSMVDVQLFSALIKALPLHAKLLIVGDIDQLPSVGAGKVLSDIIISGIIPVVRLDQIFRQAKTSDIITNAHKINKGIMPDLTVQKQDTDFYFAASEPETVMPKIIKMIRDRIPEKFNMNPVTDVQVLCPMKRGGVGSQSINIELQKVLNSNYSEGIEKYGQIFAEGDKVMQVVNDYNKDVYNGDIGYIQRIDKEEATMIIDFEGRDVEYEYSDLDQVTLAYATTIHKSQGSEYTAVIIPITMQSFMMLKRNLIYTGVTRGRKLVILVGQKKALAMAVKNTKELKRYSKLAEWLTMDED